jgi:plasmid stabilization system protein ParE
MPKPDTIHISIAHKALDDLHRLEDFLLEQSDPLAGDLLPFVMQGLAVLMLQPGVGRPVGAGHRELIISRGRGGYLARYQYQRERQVVTVLRIRHQKESGYTEEEV